MITVATKRYNDKYQNLKYLRSGANVKANIFIAVYIKSYIKSSLTSAFEKRYFEVFFEVSVRFPAVRIIYVCQNCQLLIEFSLF